MFLYDKFWDRVSTQRTWEYDWKIKMEAIEAKAEEAEAKTKEAEAKLKQKDIDVARKLKAMNLTSEQIAEATGLTVEQIEAI